MTYWEEGKGGWEIEKPTTTEQKCPCTSTNKKRNETRKGNWNLSISKRKKESCVTGKGRGTVRNLNAKKQERSARTGLCRTLISLSDAIDLGKCAILTSRGPVTSFLPITLYEVFITVKPVLSDHPTVQGKMVAIDGWSLKQGFPETDQFFEALLNSCKRCGTHTFDLRNDNSSQSGASGGLMRWFSRKLALWWLFWQ